MFNRVLTGWALGACLALALGVVTAAAVRAAESKEKAVHHTGIVTKVSSDSISLKEHHFLGHHVVTYPLSGSPTVQLSSGGTGAISDVAVGSKVTVGGTQGPDKKVTVSEVKIVAPPKKK
jgi:hypothetical protein